MIVAVRAGLGDVARIELVMEGVLSGLFKQAGDLKRQIAQVLRGLFA